MECLAHGNKNRIARTSKELERKNHSMKNNKNRSKSKGKSKRVQISKEQILERMRIAEKIRLTPVDKQVQNTN